MKPVFGELKKDWMQNVPRETATNAAQVVKEHFSQVYPLKHLNTIICSCNNLWVTWHRHTNLHSASYRWLEKDVFLCYRNMKVSKWNAAKWNEFLSKLLNVPLAFHLPSIYSLVPANNIFCQVLNLLVLDIYNGIDFWEASSTWIQ